MCDLKSIQHIKSLPFVKSTLDYVNNAYDKIKNSNRIIGLGLESAEETLRIGIDLSQPTLILFDVPLHVIDDIVDYTLYAVEDKFPIIKSTPEEVMKTTKKYTHAVGQKIELAKLVALCETGYYLDLASMYFDKPVKASLKFATNIQPTTLPHSRTCIHQRRTRPWEKDIFTNLCETKTLLQINAYVKNNIELLKMKQEQNSCLVILHVQHLNDIKESDVIYPKAQELFKDVLQLIFKLQKVFLGRVIFEITEMCHLQIRIFSQLYHLTILCLLHPHKFAIKIKELWKEYSIVNDPEIVEKAENLSELIQILIKHGIRHLVHFSNATMTKLRHIPDYALKFLSYALQVLGSFLQIIDFQNQHLKRFVVISKEYLSYILHKFLQLVTGRFVSSESSTSTTSSASISTEKTTNSTEGGTVRETTEDTEGEHKRKKRRVSFQLDEETDTEVDENVSELVTVTEITPEEAVLVEETQEAGSSTQGSKSIIKKTVVVTTTTTRADNGENVDGEFSDAHTETKVSEEFIEVENGQVTASGKKG